MHALSNFNTLLGPPVDSIDNLQLSYVLSVYIDWLSFLVCDNRINAERF